MTKEAINALDKCRDFLRNREQIMRSAATSDRKAIAQDKKDLNRLNGKQTILKTISTRL
jgi:hypothetical protein